MLKHIAGAMLLAVVATPVAAAEFFVVQDSSTKRCTITEQRPTASSTVVVGDGKVFTTRNEAESAMKTIKVCEQPASTGTTTIVR
jgi:hypothetical protein